MELFSICHKRIPVVFINKIEGNKTTTEGICLKCAHEMGIPLVEKNIRDMELTEEDIERMSPRD